MKIEVMANNQSPITKLQLITNNQAPITKLKILHFGVFGYFLSPFTFHLSQGSC